MYNKSKNKVLFAIFILIILLIIFVLIMTVYSSKEKSIIEEYKISLNNAIYDKDYNYIVLDSDATLKKEWDGNYYLKEDSSSLKYNVGTEPVFFEKTKNQLTIFGNVYQVLSDGEIVEKNDKVVVNDVSNFQFFKLSDRKYLIVGKSIKSEDVSTSNYLLVSLDKAGNATLLNNDINIKTINPLLINTGDVVFDVANEKLIISDKEINLKKINGSTNEYVEKPKEEPADSNNNINNNVNNNVNNNTNNTGNVSVNNGVNNDSYIYNEIINQLINISGLISSSKNNVNLYKNISLRSTNAGSTFIDVEYSIIDPESKYLSVFLVLKDENGISSTYYISKDASYFRISGLSPNKQYELSIQYTVIGNSNPIVADALVVLTNSDPTSVRVTQLNGNILTYNVKIYDEYQFSAANVLLTDCSNNILGIADLNIQNALSWSGEQGNFVLNLETLSVNTEYYVCLNLTNVKDINGQDITINSYHKVKIK